MRRLRRFWKRATLAYHVMCARDDARSRNVVVPSGVWVCAGCRFVSLTRPAFTTHLALVHA